LKMWDFQIVILSGLWIRNYFNPPDPTI
jgi:hypothetical protein